MCSKLNRVIARLHAVLSTRPHSPNICRRAQGGTTTLDGERIPEFDSRSSRFAHHHVFSGSAAGGFPGELYPGHRTPTDLVLMMVEGTKAVDLVREVVLSNVLLSTEFSGVIRSVVLPQCDECSRVVEKGSRVATGLADGIETNYWCDDSRPGPGR